MVRHNNAIPNSHFRKHWQRYVRTWFDQPGQKRSRRMTRIRKAAQVAPRPVKMLRPVVHCPTFKYNMKTRLGRGFSLAELKTAGVSKKLARTIGIAVDHRRKNRSAESIQANVQRLGEYKSRLLVFPLKPNKPKKGDSSAEELKLATQLKGEVLPLPKPKSKAVARAITSEEKKYSVFQALRTARSNARLAGLRAKRSKDAAAEEAMKK